MRATNMEDKITEFFGRIENDVQRLEYGTITVTVMIKDGLPLYKTTHIVKNIRRKYKVKNLTKAEDMV